MALLDLGGAATNPIPSAPPPVPQISQKAPSQPVISPIQPTPTGGTPSGLDPIAYTLTKAIGLQESGGDYTASGKSGEYGAYQNIPATWAARSAAAGINAPIDQATPEQQNEVMYKWVDSKLKAGYTPAQIASMQNAGEGAPDAYKGNAGTNSYGVKYDTAVYVQGVQQHAEQLYASQSPQNAPQPMQQGQVDSSTEAPSLGGFGQNIIKSGANFAGNLINAVAHPIQTGQNLLETGAGGFQELGGQTNDNTAKFDQLKNYFVTRYGSPEQLLHTAYTDPVGLAGDVSAALGIGGGVVGAVGKVGELAGATDVASTVGSVAKGLNKASEVTNPLTPVVAGASKLGSATSGPISTFVGKGVGLSGDAVKALVRGELQTTDLENVSRASIAQDIKNALDERDAHLSDTGKGYDPIREAGAVPNGYENVKNTPPANAIPVSSNFLEEELRNTAKLEVQDGTIKPTTTSKVSKSEVSKLQEVLDTFKPSFQRGYITPEEFLTLRHKLAKAAYNDSGVKNTDVAKLAEDIRNNLNTSYRGAVPGLEELDNSYSSELSDLNKLRKGFLDRHGNLLEGATNKIANAGKAGKEDTLARLEQISPGITQRLQAMKLIEEIVKAKSGGGNGLTGAILSAGEKGGAISGVITGNIPVLAASLGTALLTSPNLVIPVLKMIGDNKELLHGVVNHLAKYATLGATARKLSQESEQTNTQDQQTQSTTTQSDQSQVPSAPTNPTSVSSLDSLASSKGFDLAAARKAGYSDADIQQFLQTQS